MKNEVVSRRIQRYGRVLFSRANKVPGTEILTGTLTFKMLLQSPIPSFIQVGPYCLSVGYDEQPQTCRKCNEVGHMARECQVKRSDGVALVVCLRTPRGPVIDGREVSSRAH